MSLSRRVGKGSVEPLPWGAAVLVGQQHRTVEHIGLALVVERHGHAAGDKTPLQFDQHGGFAMHLKAERFGGALAREVVFGRPQASGKEHDVGAAQRDARGIDEMLAVIPDDGLEGDRDAKIVETLGKVEGVCVLTVRRQHLGTNGDDLG